jgi:hypothetical protein
MCRDFSDPRDDSLPMKTIKKIILVLCVCGLCSKAVMHTYRHFNPPPAPIIGP